MPTLHEPCQTCGQCSDIANCDVIAGVEQCVTRLHAYLEDKLNKHSQELQSQLDKLSAGQCCIHSALTGFLEKENERLDDGFRPSVNSDFALNELQVATTSTDTALDELEAATTKERTSKLSGEINKAHGSRATLAEALAEEAEARRLKETSHSRIRRSARYIVDHTYCKIGICCLICVNAVVLGIEVEYEAHNLGSTSWVFTVSDALFTLIFALELTIHVVAERWSFAFGGGALWNLIDTCIVVSGIANLVVDVFLREDHLDQFRLLSSFRFVKAVKAIRIIRIVHLARMFTGLRILIIALLEAINHASYLLAFLFVIIYSCSLLLTQSATAKVSEGDHDNPVFAFFGTLPRSVNTLFQCITGGMDWRDAAEALSDVHWACVLLLVFYVGFAVLIMLNIMTGLFCQSAITAAMKDQDAEIAAILADDSQDRKLFLELFRSLDDFGSDSPEGMFTLDELTLFIQIDRIAAQFKSLEIRPQDAGDLFKVLDKEHKGYVQTEEFVDGCMRCRGTAKGIEVHLMRYEYSCLKHNLQREMQQLNERVNSIIAEVHGVKQI